MSSVVVIAGLSGAGRTQVGNAMEDLGWFVIDNLPASLIPKVAELSSGPRSATPKVALVVGSGPATDEVPAAIQELRESGAMVRVVFLDAATDVLIRRYESTKRRHPLSDGDSVGAAIERERALLTPVRESADLVIDTSGLTIHELRVRATELFSDKALESLMQTTVMSFGYKYGLPSDVDLVIDCRFLPNPYWDEQLRPLSGLDREVIAHLFKIPVTGEFLERLESLLDLLVPLYRSEGKAYLTIALGCTGGRHRSVVIAEAIADALRRAGIEPRVFHRDIDR
ncbi:MAG TPA: RNase adapter RapZ [Microthrixaceae bacterium]|nr:RNase adapter RapZ [Microthrixaceae bacterium]